MAVKLRLARRGRKKDPHYKVVVADSRSPRDGKFIEIIGHYHPKFAKDNSSRVVFNEDRVRYWMSVGAQPSETVSRLFKNYSAAA